MTGLLNKEMLNKVCVRCLLGGRAGGRDGSREKHTAAATIAVSSKPRTFVLALLTAAAAAAAVFL